MKALHFKRMVAAALCIAVICSPLLISAQAPYLSYESLYNEDTVGAEFFAKSNEYKEQYPNGAVMFPIVSAELKMKQLYAIELYRLGGTEGEATVSLETVDFTAAYGTDYEIYLSNERGEKPIEGEAALVYAMQDYSFIPLVTQSETQVEGNNDNAGDVLSSLMSNTQGIITPSSSFKVTFADGECRKKIYVKTLKDSTVTADLEFVINLTSAEGCTLGTQSTLNLTVKEEREKPETQLEIIDTQVNPESEQAYVVIARGGNLGTYGSYRVVTESDTARAGEDYEPIQLQLDFIPGMSEQKIPINILSGAKSGRRFNVRLENIKNAKALRTTAVVTLSFSTAVEQAHETAALTSSAGTKDLGRDREYIPLSSFSICTKTNRGIGTRRSWFTKSSKYSTLGFNNNGVCKNNAISIRTDNKINFSGVEKISMVIDNLYGSTAWDHNAIYVSDDDKFNSNTGNYDWLDSLASDGIGDSWKMTNLVDDHIVRTTPTLNASRVNGEHYLYITLHKGACTGEASFKIYSDGSSENNVILHLKKYNISILAPDSVQLYKDGSLSSVAPVTGLSLSSADIYRGESVLINGTIDSRLDGHVKLKGIVFCDPSNNTKTSELISLSNHSFTLTPEIIAKYSGYFKNNSIVIKPVYTVDTASVVVGTYGNARGMRLEQNGDCTAIVYKNDELIGSVSWTKSERENNAYLIGDELKFTFTPNESVSDANISIDVQNGSTGAELSSSPINTYRSAGNSITCTVSQLYNKITPYVSFVDLGLMIHIKNPEIGDIIGRTDAFTQTGSDGGYFVNGYVIPELNSTKTVDFNDLSVGSVLSVYAQIKDKYKESYRAKWSFTDSVTNTKKVYYGNSFFYTVQYSLNEDDNNIELSFEKIGSASLKAYYVNGQTSIQQGTILNKPSLDSAIYTVVQGATVTIGDYMGVSDASGEFYLEKDLSSGSGEKAQLKLSGDEVIRALVMYNNQYRVVDVEVKEYIKRALEDTITFPIKLDYIADGPYPKSITATDSANSDYLDAIPLASGKPISFELALDLARQDKDSPVNMVRWTVESKDAVKYTYDDSLDGYSSLSHASILLSEYARPGMKLYVELFCVTVDRYISYGKFDSGYSFVATAADQAITYAPDIGVPSTMALPAPCIGPFNPTFTFFGISPIINMNSSGKDSQGRELKTITLGFSFSKLKDYAKKTQGNAFTTVTPIEKAQKMASILDSYSKCYNDTGKLPLFAGGQGLVNALNMKTSAKLTLSVALCYQASFYVDEKTNDWMIVSRVVIAGFGGNFSVSVPFTFFYIPCFTYVTFALNTNIYVGMFPKTDGETGSTVALTLKQLDDAECAHIQGVYEIKGNVTFGLGVGFDGLVSASGRIVADVDIQFNDFLRGCGNLTMSGGVTVELLLFKYAWTESFLKVQLFNTLAENPYSLSRAAQAFNNDLLSSVSLGDMTLETVEDETVFRTASGSVFDESLSDGENVLTSTSVLVSPSIIKLGGGRFMVMTIVSKVNDDGAAPNHKLYYAIYDEATGAVIEHGYVLDKYLTDLNSGGLRSAVALEQLNYLDSGVQMTDCGEDILIMWTKLNTELTDQTDNLDIMKSIGIANLYYNKASGTFHDFSLAVSENPNEIYINPKVAYNSETGIVQMFYEKMDLSGVTLDTTVKEFQNLPTRLATRYAIASQSLEAWSDEEQIAISDNALNYYDVDTVGDKVILAFVGSESAGFTLEGLDDGEYDNSLDTDTFNTVNSMYIQQFSFADGELKMGQQVKLTGENYVTANPEFVKIESGGVKNLLLFYKCNGLYAYQNINTVISQGLYIDGDGKYKLSEDYLEPDFISKDEDHTVNDDFKLLSDEDHIYALWTTTEGTQQQIMARSFCVDGMQKLEGNVARDTEGNALYDTSGNPVIEYFEDPIYILKGCWGGKTYLTSGGVNGTESGMYKKNFDALVTDDGRLFTIFNAYDLSYKNGTTEIRNNKIVLAKYTPKTEYVTTDSVDSIVFSNDYPAAGETVTAEAIVKNIGVLNGENVTAQLFVNGEKYSERTYSHWLTDESKHLSFEYLMPQGVNAERVLMQIRLVENGAVVYETEGRSLKNGDLLSIQNLSFLPIKNIGKNSDSAQYRVVATVKNEGNADYTSGKYLRIADMDISNLTLAMSKSSDKLDSVVYTVYATCEISDIKVGEVRTISFNTENIPESVFKKNAGGVSARLEGIITDSSQLEKTTFKANEKMTVLDQFYSGMTYIAKAAAVESIALEDVTLKCGNSAKLKKQMLPSASLTEASVEYSSDDTDVVSVDNLGVVTALKAGKAVITAKADGVTATATVTVTRDGGVDTTTVPEQSGSDNTSAKPSGTVNSENTQHKAEYSATGDGSLSVDTSSDNVENSVPADNSVKDVQQKNNQAIKLVLLIGGAVLLLTAIALLVVYLNRRKKWM